jgi:parallel beta-helix repeat protein
LAGNFDVGAGGDYATLNDAIAELNSRGVCGPTTFELAGGTYTGNYSISNVSGASATNTITIKPQAGATVNLEYTPTSSANNYVIRFSNVSHMSVEGLNMTNTSTGSYGRVLDFVGNNEFMNVENCTLTTTTSNLSTSTAYATLHISSSASDVLNNSTIRNNTFIGGGGNTAIYAYGNSSAQIDGLTIEGNNISNFSYYGIYYPYNTNVTIKNNEVRNNPSHTSFAYAIYSFNSTANTSVVEEVSRNKVVIYGRSTMYGVYFSSLVGNTAGNPALVVNNMITLINASTTSTTGGIHLNNGGNYHIYHNSVYIEGGSPTFGRGIFIDGFSTGSQYGNHRIVNNCVANFGGGYAIDLDSGRPVSSGYVSAMNFNNWFSTGNIGEYAGGAQPDLASWQLASSADGISISVDPKYNSFDDLHANAIGINSRGLVGLVATDIDGDVRCPAPGCPGGASPPDLGADEFDVPPTDLAPGMVISPVEGGFGCNQDPAAPVVVEIINNGSQALDFTVNPATVSWTAGGQSGSVTLNTGGIPVQGSQTVTVGTIDLTVAGTYVYDLTATVVGDMKTGNDLLSNAATVVSRDAINTFPYVEDFNSFPTCFSTPCPLPAASGWTNETNDGHDWEVATGDVPGTTTGP